MTRVPCQVPVFDPQPCVCMINTQRSQFGKGVPKILWDEILHQRSHGMIRLPRVHQQTMVSHGLKVVQEFGPSTVPYQIWKCANPFWQTTPPFERRVVHLHVSAGSYREIHFRFLKDMGVSPLDPRKLACFGFCSVSLNNRLLQKTSQTNSRLAARWAVRAAARFWLPSSPQKPWPSTHWDLERRVARKSVTARAQLLRDRLFQCCGGIR